jgi:hypothetical protein
MKKLFLTLLLATLCATSYGQTIKSLSYNTNGVVVYSGTNQLTFTNGTINFSNIVVGGFTTTSQLNAGNIQIVTNRIIFYTTNSGFQFSAGASATQLRNDLGLGATWLTNDNVTNFRTAIGLGATNNVVFDKLQLTSDLIILDGGIISFEDAGEIQFGNAAGPTRTNLGLPLPALTNTNNANFRDSIELGATNNVRFNEIDVTSTLRINDGSSTFVQLADDVAEFFIPITILNGSGMDFGGTNAATAAATTRTNLGLGATWLTNTNASEFRTAIGLIDTNGVSVFSALFLWDETNDEAALRVDEGEIITSEALIKTNGPTDTTNAARWIKVQGGTNNYFIPLFQ